MNFVDHIASRNKFLETIDRAMDVVKNLTATMIEQHKPSPGPYQLFNQNASLLKRAKEIKLIVTRLYDARIALFKNDLVENLARPADWPSQQPYPTELREFLRTGYEIDEVIVLDFQTLLLFTGIALDDWAHVAAHIVGAQRPERKGFDEIVKADGVGPFAHVWSRHRDEMLWLDAFPRLYRNKMIVHRERPWQISHSRSVLGLDWKLSTPMSSGWINEARVEKLRGKLQDIALRSGIVMPEGIHSEVFSLLQSTAKLGREDRESLYAIALETGFDTPNFQDIACRVSEFLEQGTLTLTQLATDNPGAVDLGKPPV